MPPQTQFHMSLPLESKPSYAGMLVVSIQTMSNSVESDGYSEIRIPLNDEKGVINSHPCIRAVGRRRLDLLDVAKPRRGRHVGRTTVAGRLGQPQSGRRSMAVSEGQRGVRETEVARQRLAEE